MAIYGEDVWQLGDGRVRYGGACSGKRSRRWQYCYAYQRKGFGFEYVVFLDELK